jgi:PAS domain S-box-containing protein
MSKIKALVVDNNPVLLRAVSAILEKEGCEVVSAENGLDALNLLKKYTPDIVFTDLVMPLVGGDQLCRIIRSNEELKDVFLVVVSGILLEDFDNIIAEQYYDLCIAKGNLKELREHIQDALQRLTCHLNSDIRETYSTPAKIQSGLEPSTVAMELLVEKRHLSRILGNLEEGIIELSHGGTVVALNDSARRLLEVREEGIIGYSLADYAWGEHQEKINDWIISQLQHVDPTCLEIQEDVPVRIGDRILTVSFIPVRDEGAVFGLCILRDITRQYLAEENQRQLDSAIKLITKMDAMSCMAGGIAHDFNNLLTVICGNLDIVTHTQCATNGIDNSKLLKHARTAAYMAVDLTRKISNSSPFGIISREKQVFQQIVADAVSSFENNFGVSCAVEFNDQNSLVSIDPEQIATALNNILQNASEADSQGVIEITTRKVEFDNPSIISGQYVPAGKYACVSVKDHGPGIEGAQLLNVFDPYFSTKARGALKGMGLGLTVVYATMRNHGGYVVVESTPEEGTVVSCYLPRYGRSNSTRMERESVKRDSFQIVLVENDVQLQDVGTVMLEYLGHTVTAVGTLEEAIEVIDDQRKRKKSRVDIVLIDPTEKIPVDHEKICTELKSFDDDLKVIITGDSILDPVMKDCNRYGYIHALAKPFTMDNLRHVIMTVMS